jgi:hypothetical protein
MTLAEAVKTIIKYCDGIERNCEECTFAQFDEDDNWISCMFGTIPCFWEVPIETNAYDEATSSAEPEITRCKDCIYGHLCINVRNGATDSWIECCNDEGLNRNVSVDGYCYAAIAKPREKEEE